MSLIRTKISVAGLNESEAAEGLPSFREYIDGRAWLLNPKAEWDGEGECLRVTVETEGDDAKLEAEGVFDEVWDCVIAAFDSSESLSFDILEAVKLS
jgi:hypothetical protein